MIKLGLRYHLYGDLSDLLGKDQQSLTNYLNHLNTCRWEKKRKETKNCKPMIMSTRDKKKSRKKENGMELKIEEKRGN